MLSLSTAMHEDTPPSANNSINNSGGNGGKNSKSVLSSELGNTSLGSFSITAASNAKPIILETVWTKITSTGSVLKQSKVYLSIVKLIPKIPYLNLTDSSSSSNKVTKVSPSSPSSHTTHPFSNSNANSSLNTTTVWLIVIVHSIISLLVDSSNTLKATTWIVGLLWIFGQHTIYDIDDLRQMSSWAVRNTAKSYIDNALNGSILNALWLVIVTLYMPIIYGFQHDRLFSESSVLLFAFLCSAQYLLWNLFRVYLINRHSIITDIQRYGCWKKIENFRSSYYSSLMPPVVPQQWKIGHKYSQGDVIVVSASGAKSPEGASAKGSSTASSSSGSSKRESEKDKDRDKIYYELQSASSCIVETQLLTIPPSPTVTPGGATSAGTGGDGTSGDASVAAPSVCFPLSSLLWCYCNPLLALIMTAPPDVIHNDATTTTHTTTHSSEAEGHHSSQLSHQQTYSVNAMFRCFAWDRGEVFASTVLKLLLFGITILSMLQCAVGLFESKGTQFIAAGMVNICMVLYTLVMMMVVQVQRKRKSHMKTVRTLGGDNNSNTNSNCGDTNDGYDGIGSGDGSTVQEQGRLQDKGQHQQQHRGLQQSTERDSIGGKGIKPH